MPLSRRGQEDPSLSYPQWLRPRVAPYHGRDAREQPDPRGHRGSRMPAPLHRLRHHQLISKVNKLTSPLICIYIVYLSRGTVASLLTQTVPRRYFLLSRHFLLNGESQTIAAPGM